MYAKTKIMGLTLVMLCGALMSIPTTASAGEPTLQSIVTAVGNSESKIQDLKIEYTCIRKPYGVSKDWQPTGKEKYPGWWKQETGVLQQKGNKVRLDRTYYQTTSATTQLEKTLRYNGSTTSSSATKSHGANQGILSAGRSHGFRKWFNPILTLSATGDSKLSSELNRANTEFVAGTYDVGGVSCELVKLYNKTPKGTILRSFNVYLDPDSNYAPRKIEKYWYNFKCLERVVEVKEVTKVGDVYVPTKAVCVTYVRPHNSLSSNPVTIQELNVTNIGINDSIADTDFELSFGQGDRVWNSILELNYVLPDSLELSGL